MDKIKNRIISNNETEYDYDIIKYGFEVLFFNIISTSLLLFITIYTNELCFGSTFIIVFSLLRVKFGGFHCKTPLRCLLTMFVIFYSIILFKNYLNIFSILILLIITFIDILKKTNKDKKLKILYMILSALCIIFLYTFKNSNNILGIIFAYITFINFYK